VQEKGVTVTLSNDEALVLLALLTRFSDNEELSVENRGESRALWNLCCLLEEKLSEPLKPEYADILEAARERLGQE
jgi:hypothetical protein